MQSSFCLLERVDRRNDSLLIALAEAAIGRDDLQAVRSGAKAGWLLRSHALVMVCATPEDLRFLLVTDKANEEPGRWRFPSAYSDAEGDTPLDLASRALRAEFVLNFAGRPASWGEVAIKVGGQEVTFLGTNNVNEFRGRHVETDQTLEFYYPMQLVVKDLQNVSVTDKRHTDRQARLFTAAEVFALSQDRMLSTAARKVWGSAIAEGVLAFVQTTVRD